MAEGNTECSSSGNNSVVINKSRNGRVQDCEANKEIHGNATELATSVACMHKLSLGETKSGMLEDLNCKPTSNDRSTSSDMQSSTNGFGQISHSLSSNYTTQDHLPTTPFPCKVIRTNSVQNCEQTITDTDGLHNDYKYLSGEGSRTNGDDGKDKGNIRRAGQQRLCSSNNEEDGQATEQTKSPMACVCSLDQNNIDSNSRDIEQSIDTRLCLCDEVSNDKQNILPRKKGHTQEKSAQKYNGARPKTTYKDAATVKKSRKLMEKESFVTDDVCWLWFKNAFQSTYMEITSKYHCYIKLSSLSDSDRIKITAEPTHSNLPEDNAEAEGCAKELERAVDWAKGKLITKPVERLLYTYEVANVVCVKDTYVCDDMNEGVIIIGLNETDVQLVHYELTRKYRITAGDNSPNTQDEVSINDMNVGMISDDEEHGDKNGDFTNIIRVHSWLWHYLEVFRENDLINISTDNKVRLKKISTSVGQGLKLKGSKFNVGQASNEIGGLVSELDGALDEVKIYVMPGAKTDITKVIESMKEKYERVLFVYKDSIIHIVGAKKLTHQAQQELQHKLEQMRLSHTLITKNDRAFPLSESKPKRERKLLKPSPFPFDKGSTNAITFQTKYGQKVHIFKGNITKLAVGAVVNAANCKLLHGGGVAGAIRKAAGPKLQPECSRYIKKHGPLPTGGVYTSKAYNMPCQHIIHVVGPRWSDYTDKTQAMDYLRQCFTAVLDVAGRLNVSSIAVPAVGSGIYGSPLSTVAQMMVEGVKIFISQSAGKTSVRDIILVDINKEILKLLNQKYQNAAEQGNVKSVPAKIDHFINGRVRKHDKTESAMGQEEKESQDASYGYQGSPTTSSTKGNQASGTLSVSVSPVIQRHSSGAASVDPAEGEDEICAICLETPTDKVVLDICKHVFCKDCIDTWFKNKPSCPNCGQMHGEMKGDQPDGSMTVNDLPNHLEGFNDSSGTFEINYHFPRGMQQACHPNPGTLYRSTRRTAYLPRNEEGKHVLGLLRRAFDAKLIFTIGRSTTTGRDNQITWNDIHHKTNMSGGPDRFGYPDATYLSRVQEELAAKGIK